MITMRAIALGTLLVGVMAAFSSTSGFTGTVTGGLRADMHGDAKFGVVDGRGATPSVFTLSLGATGSDGSVLFTRTSGVRPEHPTGVFRGHGGTLTVTSVSDNLIRGTYQVDALGFLAADPAAEDRAIRATGAFTARRDR